LADFGRGIKAGAAAGAIYLIISVILELTGFSFQFSSITTAAGFGISLESTDPSLLTLSILSRIVQAIIFGAIFAALYDYLPGTTSVKKGVVFSSFLWVLVAIELIYTIPGWPTYGDQTVWSVVLSVAGVQVTLPSIRSALACIISALVFGMLVGFLWDRFRSTKLIEARRGSAVLLVSFVLGIWMWASSAIGIIIYVVSRGALVIEPGPMWWANILHTLVTFIGPAGWVLALVAWRKTRRGKSGLKLGVAGGIIMALTGIMLLPGALAITGGVLSGRKPAAESSTAAIEQ
jgi:F0F1-type ATP synthase assembly protein I